MSSHTLVAAVPPRNHKASHKATSGAGKARQRPYTVWLAIIPAIAALGLGLTGASQREMWNNEYATWHAATLPISNLRLLLANTDLVHTAYVLFMHYWISILGDTPLMLRLPSVIAMAAAAGFTALLGRRLVDAPTGLVGGLLFALIPSVSRYAQEARSYAIVSMGVTLTTLLLLRAVDKPSRLRWTLYVLSVVATGWVHFVSLTVLAAHMLYVARIANRDDARRYQWAGSVGIVGLTIIPLLSFASHQSGSISWIKADLNAVSTFPEQLFLSWAAAGVLVGLGAIGLVACWRSRRTALAPLATWALLPPIFAYVTFPILHLFLARYVLFILPAWSLLAAAAICAVGALFPVRTRAWISVVVAVLAVSAFAYVVEPAQWAVRASPVTGQPDYRAAIDVIRRSMQPGDGIAYNDVFGKLSDLAREAVDYEMRNSTKPRDVFLAVRSVDRGSYSATECTNPAPCLGDTARIWLISTTYSKDGLAGLDPARAGLLRRYRVISDQKYTGVRLLLLSRAG